MSQWRGAYPGQNFQPLSPFLTDCEPCRKDEAPKPRLRDWPGLLVSVMAVRLVRDPSAAPAAMFQGQASLMQAALGGPPPPTEYEKHRDAYVESGDIMELERMLRHVA